MGIKFSFSREILVLGGFVQVYVIRSVMVSWFNVAWPHFRSWSQACADQFYRIPTAPISATLTGHHRAVRTINPICAGLSEIGITQTLSQPITSHTAKENDQFLAVFRDNLNIFLDSASWGNS